jgi:hypothetical protein
MGKAGVFLDRPTPTEEDELHNDVLIQSRGERTASGSNQNYTVGSALQ